MASLQYRDKNGNIFSLSGEAYENNYSDTKKLYIRTGTNPEDKITYGVASVESASEYSPAKMKVDNQTVYFGKKESGWIYSTNNSYSSTYTKKQNTEADPSYNEHLYSTKSSPYNSIYHSISTNSSVGRQVAGAADTIPTGFPTPASGVTATNKSESGLSYTVRSIKNWAKSNQWKSTKAHTTTRYWTQYYDKTGTDYCASSGTEPTFISSSSTNQNQTIGEYFKAGYNEWYNFSWTLSSMSGNRWYYYSSNYKQHGGTTGRPWDSRRTYLISARMTDYWGYYAGGYDNASYGNYRTSYSTWNCYETKYFSINWTNSANDAYPENIEIKASVSTKAAEWFSYGLTVGSKATNSTNGIKSSSTTVTSGYTSGASNKTSYGDDGACKSVYMTVTNTSQAYYTTIQAGKSSSSTSSSSINQAITNSIHTLSGTTSYGDERWSYSYIYDKNVSMSYTTNSSTLYHEGASSYTTADKYISRTTHNFI